MAGEIQRAVAQVMTDYWTTFHMVVFQKMLEACPDETNRLRPAFDEFMGVLIEVSGSGQHIAWADIRSRLPDNGWLKLLESESIEITHAELDELKNYIARAVKVQLQGKISPQ